MLFALASNPPPLAMVGIRAGNLSLINLIPLFLGPHLIFLTNILKVSLTTFRHIHGSTGLMSLCLALFHFLITLISHTTFAVRGIQNIAAIVVSTKIDSVHFPKSTDISGLDRLWAS